ncbi:MAG: IS66 family transposase [Planctomycetes bacterium]|nr:IS66 family transposase [Planctomycetota bacterium]
MNQNSIIPQLLDENKTLAAENAELREIVVRLTGDNKTFVAENAALKEIDARQASIIVVLEGRIAELERRIGLNSSNSGKPPSSDGLNKPPVGENNNRRTRSLRESSGRKSGGQKGHPGKTLCQSAEPDTVVDHFPDSCGRCGSPLKDTVSTCYQARQVFDLPDPRPLGVTEHRAHDCRCGECGYNTRASFPKDVMAPVQYGARIRAIVVYLLHFQMLPEDRLAVLMKDLFGVGLVPATIARMSRGCAMRFQGVVDWICGVVKVAAVKHLDETGFRVGGKTQWLHIASTTLLTFYRISAKRGCMLADVVGIIVHDHWKSYYTMEGVLHALCNAHHLRELKALIEIEKEDWARKMQRLLRLACHLTNLAREGDRPLQPLRIARIKRCYDAIVAEGLAFHEKQMPVIPVKPRRRGKLKRRTGHNLLLRLESRREDVLRFLTDPSVPFTNNQAEQDGRMMKLRQKISGGFRSQQGAEEFAVIRSLISTARKQDWNVIQTLMQDPDSLTKRLRSA